MKKHFAASLVWLVSAASSTSFSTQSGVPTPESFLGHRVAADFKLASYDDSIGYLQQLSDNQQSVMYLFFQQGKSYKEIEAITDLSLSNVGMLLHRGLRKLKKLMQQEGQTSA